MLEFAQDFEQSAEGVSHVLLVVPGLAGVIAGLFVWLGGLRYKKTLAVVTGISCGGIGGFFIFGQNIITTVVLTIAVAILVITLEKIVLSGNFLWRIIFALFGAAIGTTLIFAGMSLLLLYKGAAPISHISSKEPFYGAVFAIMVALGTIEQLLFCQITKKQPIKKGETKKSGKN